MFVVLVMLMLVMLRLLRLLSFLMVCPREGTCLIYTFSTSRL